MSIIRLITISDYWSKSEYLGQQIFKRVTSFKRFQLIRSSIQFHPRNRNTMMEKHMEPLWQSRITLEQFQKQCA